MPSPKASAPEDRAILDLASYARRGPGRRVHLSAAEIAQISRTVRRVPEVLVKVTRKGSSSPASFRGHVGYIGRHGTLKLETDQGTHLGGKESGRTLSEDWDLDLDDRRSRSALSSRTPRKRPTLVRHLLLAMPAGTPAQPVLAAARNFLRDEFALKHRYAFVLHTDQPHPHMHAVVKAVSEQGVRLNLQRATLRRWREDFARHLRAQGIEANATARAVRGESRVPKLDGIYRAARAGVSHSFVSGPKRSRAS